MTIFERLVLRILVTLMQGMYILLAAKITYVTDDWNQGAAINKVLQEISVMRGIVEDELK